jgi:N-acetylneuraminic acid mutarotase
MKKIFVAGVFVLFAVVVNAQNVGIGTATPTEKLEVKKALRSTLKISSGHYVDTTQLIFSNKFSPTIGTDFSITSIREDGLFFSSSSDVGPNNSPNSLVITGDRNVGIGTPTPLQKLDVNGAIKIGTTATNQPGAIRFNAGKFEGGDGTNWKSFEGTASGIVGTKLYNNPALLNAGYSLFGEIPGISSYSTINTTFSANTWQPTYTRGIIANLSAPPEKLYGEGPDAVVCIGSLMYVARATNLYSYNPVTDLWSIVSNQGFTTYSKAVWTGTEIVFWSGGFGSRYNPATNIWTALPVTNAPSPRGLYTMIWDGTRVIIWGGQSTGGPLNTGAMYNPVTNIWTTMNTVGAPTVRYSHTAVWNNTAGRMIIWGGSWSEEDQLNTGGIFDPFTNTWSIGGTNTFEAPPIRTKHTAIWTGTEMIVFGGQTDNGYGYICLNDGYKYNYSTNAWTLINTTGAPIPIYNHAAIWTGTAMFVTGGVNGEAATNGTSSSRSYSYNPATNLWAQIASFTNNTAGQGKDSHYSFLAGNIIIIYGGKNTQGFQVLGSYVNTGYRYFLVNTASSATTITNETLYLYQKN